MSALLILIIAIALLACGYIFYGSWLAKQWGVDPNKETPAHTSYDGNDFVPANPAVLMGHHFSSIAGAGPINGPILASGFGLWAVFAWVIVGGIFIGAMHDFGALFASIRHNGGSVGEVVKDAMGVKAQRLFSIFALLVLILVIASFTNVVANTFKSDAASFFTTGEVASTAATATTSLLFILIAFVFGFFVYRKNAPVGIATVIGIIGVAAIIFVGQKLGVNMGYKGWVIFIAVYVTLASMLPVWMLLQPRDYLSSFLLYAMMLLAIFAIAFSGAKVDPAMPMITWKNAAGANLFPTLFITVACGAVSGFHSLIASGTTSKQLDSEKDAKVIGYGAMIVESALAICSLLAVGVIFSKQGELASPAVKFAAGLATMASWATGGEAELVTSGTVYNLLTLAVSVFALTSLDSGCRLARYMFSELFIPEGKSYADLKGIRKFFATPIVATLTLVIIGCGLGMNPNLSAIWGVFGAANQLLAGLAMLAVAAWLAEIGKNNKMFIVPMIFMLAATLTSLVTTILNNFKAIGAGGADWTVWYTAVWSLLLVVLAVILAIDGAKVLTKKKA